MLRSGPMTKTLLCLTALLILTGCRSTSSIKATPLKEQNATQVAADRKKCDEWSKSAGAPLTGYASCMVAAGYETTAEVDSSSQTLRLAGASPEKEPTRVLIDVLQCDGLAKRDAERTLGFIRKWIRDTFGGWTFNAGKRRQSFVECLTPRGYEIGKR